MDSHCFNDTTFLVLDLIFHNDINTCKEIIHIAYGATMRLYVYLMHIGVLFYNRGHKYGAYLLYWDEHRPLYIGPSPALNILSLSPSSLNSFNHI